MCLRFENTRIFKSSGLKPNDARHFRVFVKYPIPTVRAKPTHRNTTGRSWSLPTFQLTRHYLESGALEDHRYAKRTCGQFLAILTVTGDGYEWLFDYFVIHVAALA